MTGPATRARGSTPGGAAFHGLHVLADDDPRWGRDPVEQARLACAGGAAVVQLRAKHATDTCVLTWGRAIRSLCDAHGACFVLNDRFDLALACGADAVHLGQTDLPPGALPGEVRARLAVGRSTHDVAQARAACDEDVDYVAFGPLFTTASKETGYGARGLERLAEIVSIVCPRPVVAIGGIDVRRIDAVMAAGAAGAAVIAAVVGADDPEAATRELASHMEHS